MSYDNHDELRDAQFSAENFEPYLTQHETAPEKNSNGAGEKKTRAGAQLFELVQMITAVVIIAVVMFNCALRLTRVDGHSMDYTLQDGELMLVWSPFYTPKTGDIVVVNKTTASFLSNRAIVKRVIATAGQTVDIDYAHNAVYVDGVALDEPYIKEEMDRPWQPTMQQTHWEVPQDSIFVMGDNRNGSTDSRDEQLGVVHLDYVIGKAAVSLWPMSKLGVF